MKKAIVLAAIMILGLSVAANAADGLNIDAKVSIHVLPHASRTCAKNFPTYIDSCDDIINSEASMDCDCFVVFFDLVEYQGFDYALTWPGANSCAFTSCSPLAIGTITWPGDGISHAWYACQPNHVAIPGWGWIYDTGLVCVIAHPTAGGPNAGDCASDLNVLPAISIGCAGLGGAVGYVPACELSVEPTTWGGIKSLYR